MLFVCIEGPDGTGKSTQVKELKRRLEMRGYNVFASDVPFNGLSRRLAYWMLRTGLARKFPVTFQTIMYLNRLFWQTLRYRALYVMNDVIIVGRWSMSATIYGTIEGVPRSTLEFMRRTLIEPDCTFVLQGKDRQEGREKDCYEAHDEMQRRIKDAYIQECNRRNVHAISSNGSIDEVSDKIENMLWNLYDT